MTKMTFEQWEKNEKKQETAKKMVMDKLNSSELNEMQRGILESIDFEKVEGKWKKETRSVSVYFPTLFESLFIFGVSFVYDPTMLYAGSDKAGRILVSKNIFDNKDNARFILEQEIKFAIFSNRIQTRMKVEEEKVILF